MEEERQQQYRLLEARIGNTPLVLYDGEVPHGNKIWIKRECDNPFGSHYDRVYFALFQHYEKYGRIKQGDKVLETSSGTAGVSCASIAKLLGYECHLAIPEGVDEAVIQKIREEDAVLYFTPEADYINGFPEFVRKFLPKHKDIFFLNHSMGERHGHAYANNEIVLSSLGGIATEVVAKMPVDFYLPAVGNGSSILGPGRIFKPTTKIIAFESSQSAVAYDLLHPGEYERRFGIKPGVLPRHKLRGTSFQGIHFPHIENAVKEGIINDVVLVSDVEVSANYFTRTQKNYFNQLPHWDASLLCVKEYGRSTRAGVVAALEIAKKIESKNFVIIAYDKADRYDL
ncbi:MAG: pyridoxal-phosphate dependent enzyme [Candidatus Woesearchaeota archaeon]